MDAVLLLIIIEGIRSDVKRAQAQENKPSPFEADFLDTGEHAIFAKRLVYENIYLTKATTFAVLYT